MDSLKFITSLLPRFERDTLTEDIRVTRDELRNMTLPIYRSAVAQFDGARFASDQVRELDKEITKEVNTRVRGNSIRLIYEVLVRCEGHLDELEGIADDAFSKDISASSVTYRKASLIQTVEAVGFVCDYARSLLAWIMTEEAYVIGIPGSVPADEAMKKPELEWLFNRKRGFISMLSALINDTDSIKSKIDKIPDIKIDPEDHSVVRQTHSSSDLDPMRFGFVAHRMNPIYYISMSVAEWQASRYRKAKAEQKLLELRLLQLHEDNREQPNAKLQQNIEYNQERLSKLKFKITKMEERYA